MANVLDNVFEFKELVLSGMPKVFNKEEFESSREQEAVTLYLIRFGLRVDPYTGEQLTMVENRIDFDERLYEGVRVEILNTFRGSYGI